MTGQEELLDEGPLYNRPSSLYDSPDSSALCEELEQLHTLQSRPGDLGNDMSPESPTSALEKQLSRIQPRSPVDKKVDQLFQLPRPYLTDPLVRKRVEDLDTQMHFLSEPSPSKRSRLERAERRRGRPRKEEISENEDLRTVAKRMYARAYRENVSFYIFIQMAYCKILEASGRRQYIKLVLK